MRGPLFALAAALLGAAAAGVAVALLLSEGNITVQQNLFVNPAGIIDANNSPTVVRNPTDPDNLVIVHRVDRPRFTAALHWSDDGGATWQATTLPLPAGKDRAYAPDAAFAGDGSLYVIYVNLVGRGNVPESLWIARSTDGGQTLSEPDRIGGSLAFQGRVAVDLDGVVHVTYLQADQVGLLQLIGTAPIVAVRSDDGGRTWSSPVRVSDEGRQRVGAATPVVDSSGDLVVLYQDFKGDIRNFQNLDGPPWGEPYSLVVTRSGDGGGSFSSGVEFESDVVPSKRFLVFLPEFPSIAAGPDQSVYAVWSDARNEDEDVFLRRSLDGGRTWSRTVRVNDNPAGDGTSQWLPAAAVAPNGRVDVLYLDRRRDPQSDFADVFLASSGDGGRSFTSLRASSSSFDTRIGPSAAPHLEPDLGSRLGLESWDGGAFAAWADTRLGDAASGRQDVVGARIDVPDPAAMRNRRLLVVALLAAAVVALVRWRAETRATKESG